MKKEELKKFRYEQSHKIKGDVLYKKCNHHKELFPKESEWLPCTEDYFYKNKSSGVDGLNPECKRCTIKKAQQNRKENIEIRKAYDKKRNENSLEWRKEYDRNVWLNEKKREGKLKATSEWQKTERGKEKLKQYAEKRQHKNHKINKKEWDLCKEYFNNECAYCGLDIKNHYYTYRGEIKLGDLHKEHVVHDGNNDLSNCIPACKSCNTSKHIETMETWYKRQSFFDEKRLNKINKWLNEDWKLYYIEKKPRKPYKKKTNFYLN